MKSIVTCTLVGMVTVVFSADLLVAAGAGAQAAADEAIKRPNVFVSSKERSDPRQR